MTDTFRSRARAAWVLRVMTVMALLATSAVLAADPADASPRARTTAEVASERQLFNLHNDARRGPASFGYSSTPTAAPLRWSNDLADVARAWSDVMAREHVLRHNPHFATESCCWTFIGENVGWSEPADPDSNPSVREATRRVMQGYMDSEGHRNNLMNPTFQQVGIGSTIHDGRLWTTIVFRAPDRSAPRGSASYTPPATAGPSPTIRSTGHACPRSAPAARFADLTRTEQRTSVGCLAWWDITRGVDERTFDPRGNVTRGQMASFMARAIEATGGQLPAAPDGRFSDVARGTTHSDAINTLSAAGVISGFPDGTFQPAQPVRRDQMAKFLTEAHRYRNSQSLPAGSRDWFSDVTGQLRPYVNQAADAGWAGGYGDGRYGPRDVVRRDQMASFLARWLDTQVAEHAATLPR